MPAYTGIVEWADERPGGIYFAKSNVEARRMLADEYADGEFAGLTVQRAPGLDKYEDDGAVPMAVMIGYGWWTECSNCYQRLSEDQLDEDGKDYTNVVGHLGQMCFCDQGCLEEYQREYAMKRSKKYAVWADMEAWLASKFGDVDVLQERRYAYIEIVGGVAKCREATLYFNYPGCEHGPAGLQLVEKSSETIMSLTRCNGDDKAFREFYLARTGIHLDMGTTKA